MQNVFLCWLTSLGCATAVFAGIYWYAAPPSEKAHELRVPTSFDEVKELAKVLDGYARHHEAYSMLICTYFMAYVKAFSIPGMTTMRLISGALYGVTKGMAVVWTGTMIGSAANYKLADVCLRDYLEGKYASGLRWFRRTVAKRRGNLFWYLLSLIIVPFIPNPFIISACALARVSMGMMLTATGLGILPVIYVEVASGEILKELHSGHVVTWRLLLLLVVLALLVALPAHYLD